MSARREQYVELTRVGVCMHTHKLLTRKVLLTHRSKWRQEGKSLVFTNGCFDLLHRGHVEYLQQARGLGDLLVVGLNSDDSVRRLKGPDRPVVAEADRAAILCGLQDVDFVTLFPESSVEPLVAALLPDVLVKGGDYKPEDVVGRQLVEEAGGRVATLCLVPGQSTTELANKALH